MLDIYKCIFHLTCVKLTTGLEISKDLSFASVEIDKNCWLTLPRWKSLCHSLPRDQPQPGSFFQRPREAEKRDPGNEVDWSRAKLWHKLLHRGRVTNNFCRSQLKRKKGPSFEIFQSCCKLHTGQMRYINFYYIDTGVLLKNIPLVKFIKTTSGTRVVYFP